jgi:hypothetical protein
MRTGRMRQWRLLSKTLVRAFGVVRRPIVGQDAVQVPFIDDEQVIEAFLPNTAHPAFGKGVGIRSFEGSQPYLNLIPLLSLQGKMGRSRLEIEVRKAA